MFIIGAVKQNEFVAKHPAKVIGADMALATTLFVVGMLMLTRVLPGATYGVLPSSVGFLYSLCLLATGVVIVKLHDDPHFLGEPKPKTVKDKTKEFRERINQITNTNADWADMKELYDGVLAKLNEQNLANDVREKLEKVKQQMEAELKITPQSTTSR